MSESVKLYNPSGREVKVAADKVQEHLVRGFTYAPTAPKKVVEKIIANAKANKASVALVNKSAREVKVAPERVFELLKKGYKIPEEEEARAEKLPDAPESEEEAEKASIEDMSDDELREHAKAQGVSVTKRMDRAAIIKALP
tara:strand:+ start:87 stop:512 length:426 start_codon:yes stop_codon:yes gene_type:complete